MSAHKEVFGDATLFCGDCLEVMPQLPAGSVTLLWTDPPYGHNNMAGDLLAKLNGTRNRASMPIENDGPDMMRDVVDGMLRQAARLLCPESCCCCCAGGGGPHATFAWLASRLDGHGLQFFHAIVWDKKNPGLGWRYRRRYEFVMVAHRQGAKLAWNDAEEAISNIICEAPPQKRCHPNEKPLKLMGLFVKKHSLPGDLVLDPFMGSGSTGVAAIQLGRRFIGIELSPRWFDVACRRMEAALRETALLRPAPAAAMQAQLLPEVVHERH